MITINPSATCDLKAWLIVILCLLLFSTPAAAGPPATASPFACDSPVYQVARRASQLIRITVTGSSATFSDIGSGNTAALNAGWGYNEQDSFAYAILSGSQKLFMVDGTGSFYDLGVVAGMGSALGSNAGDVLPDGTMVFKNNTRQIMRLDLNVEPYTISSTFALSGAAARANYADIAYNPIDGMIYTIDHKTDTAFYFDPATGATTYFGSSNLTGSYGGLWFDEDGYFYAYDNNSNSLFIVDAGILGSGTGKATLVAVSPIDEGGINDGLSCRGPALLPLLDYGDANTSYGDSPHRIPTIPTIYLGNNKPDIDSTPKNAANGSADGLGDDNDGNDDEDGVSFTTLVQGEQATISVKVAGAGGYLQGWIDWNADGVFSATEQVAANAQDNDNDGLISLTTLVPNTASATQTTARFRWSTDNGISYEGEASDGEAEDYLVTVFPPVFLTLIKSVINDDIGVEPVSAWTLRAIGDSATHSGLTGDPSVTNTLVTAGTYTLSELGPADYLRTSISCDGGSLTGDQLTLGNGDNVSCTFTNNDLPLVASCDFSSYVAILPSDLGLSATASQTGVTGSYDISQLFGFSSGLINLNLTNAAIQNNRFVTSDTQATNWSFDNTGYPMHLRVEHEAALSGDGNRDGFTAVDGVMYSPQNSAPAGYFYNAVQRAVGLDYFAEAGPTATNQSQPFIWESQQTANQLSINTTNSSTFNNDYAIQAALCLQEDWSDANASYGTANHTINTDVYLGTGAPPDADSGSQSSASADGDDNDGNDDEDGISSFPVLTNTHTDYAVDVSCKGTNSTVAAWIDFNNDGLFDTAERNSNHPVNCTSGTVTLEWSGLIGLVPSMTYIRIRTAIDETQVAMATGSASSGEVEDYTLVIANQTMTTPPSGACVAEGGAITSNNLITDFDNGSFGSENGYTEQSPELDPYPNQVLGGLYAQYQKRTNGVPIGQPTFGQYSYVANVITARNDTQHEPVVDPVYGMTGRFFVSDPDNDVPQVKLSVSGLVPFAQYEYSFWAANAERSGAANDISVSVNGNTLYSSGPLTAVSAALPWQLYSFTFTNDASTSATIILSAAGTDKAGNDFYLDNLVLNACDFLNDFGDAPSSYGAAHHISPLIPNLLLGSSIDEEASSQFSPQSDGDDTSDSDDEDGISSLLPLADTDRIYQVTTSVTNLSGVTATLMAWIDFDGNGSFDQDEAATRQIANGTNNASLTLQWSSIPQDIQKGDTHLRVRLSNEGLNTSEATGKKRDGEVEDYPLTIADSLSVSGRVYHDDNADGINDNSESGIANVTVVLFEPNTASCRYVKTNGSGQYRFTNVAAGTYQVFEAGTTSAPLCAITAANDPATMLSTTDNVRPVFTLSTSSINEQDFGDIRPAIFEPDHQSQVLPGNVVFYAHRFKSPAAGSVSFSQTNTGNNGWTSLLYIDHNCDGSLNGTEANAPIFGPTPVNVDTAICLINKVYAPANAATGDVFSQILTADFDTDNTIAGNQILTVKDVTTAQQGPADASSNASRLQLTKTVQNLTQGTAETETINAAAPGDLLQYQIYYRNTGTGPINDLVINDTVPVMTLLMAGSASCITTPAELSCNATENQERVDWQFTGTLLGGKQGVVSYETILDQ